VVEASLFAAIGTAWGSGDGSSTFNIPDLRGRFMRGVDTGAGNDPDRLSRTTIMPGGNTGDAVGSLQLDEIKSHTHGLKWWATGGQTLPNVYPGFANSYNPGVNQASSKGVSATGGAETRPKNVNVTYIIKY